MVYLSALLVWLFNSGNAACIYLACMAGIYCVVSVYSIFATYGIGCTSLERLTLPTSIVKIRSGQATLGDCLSTIMSSVFVGFIYTPRKFWWVVNTIVATICVFFNR